MAQATLLASVIPPARITQWKGNVGVDGGIPTVSTIYTNLGTNATLTQINSAISMCPSGQVVQLAAGTYNLGAASLYLSKNGVVLRGAGMTNTILVSTKDVNGQGGSIIIGGRDLVNWPVWNLNGQVNWTNGYTQGTSNLVVDSTNGLTVGTIVGLSQLNDWTEVTTNSLVNGGCEPCGVGTNGSNYTTTADRLQEQWSEVKAINGYTVTIWPPLSATNWNGAQSPLMFWVTNTVKRVGIENLTIDGSAAHPGGPYSANIYFLSTWNCWIMNVKSLTPYESHIALEYGGRAEVRHSYFYDTQFEGIESYGFQPSKVSFCWMEDCIWNKVTAPVQLGTGGGHVISYNYMTNMVYTPAPGTFHASIWQHQAYNSYNLYEGNYCDGVDFDDWHGSSGFQTVFRNVLTGQDGASAGNPVVIWPLNYYVNVVGNILGTTGSNFHVDGAVGSVNSNFYDDAIYAIGWYGGDNGPGWATDPKCYNTIYRDGNYDVVTNTVTWDSSDSTHTLPTSYVYSSKPSWWGNGSWPPYDPSRPNSAASTNIPAGYRFVNGVDPPSAVAPPATPAYLIVQ